MAHGPNRTHGPSRTHGPTSPAKPVDSQKAAGDIAEHPLADANHGEGQHARKTGEAIDFVPLRQALFRQQSAEPDLRSGHRNGLDGRTSGSPPGEASTGSRTGYRNPPQATRFVKGQSGNPAGRPRGSGKSKPTPSPLPESLDELRRRLVATPVRIRESEGTRELPLIEALSRQLDKLAFAGGVQATRLSLARHEETMRRQEAEYEENRRWVAEHCAWYRDYEAACKRAGKPVPDWIARPEDIHLSREKGLRIIGPYTPEGLENHLLLRRWRDAMQLRMIYDSIVFFAKPASRTTFTMAEFIVHWLDHLMPARWKLDGKEARDREAMFLWASRPRLREKLEEAFDALGLKAPLDHPMPPIPDRLLRTIGIKPKQIRARFAAL